MTRVRLNGVFEGTIEFLDEGNPGTPSNPASPAEPIGEGPNPGTSGRTVTAGPGQEYPTVRDAINAAAHGDTISINPATPRESFVIPKNLMILGNGLKWDFSDLPASALVYQGKAAIVASTSIWHIKDMEISGAGIRETSHSLVAAIRCDAAGWGAIERCKLHHNQNGFGADRDRNWNITLADCELHSNGLGDGLTHNIYVNNGHTLTLRNTNSVDPNVGFALKSRAYNTIIDGGTIRCGSASCIDISDAGMFWIKNATLVKPADSRNNRVISYALESTSSGVVDSNLIESTLMQMLPSWCFIHTNAGTMTFSPSCRWEGSIPTVDGSGKVIGLPA